MSSHPHLTIGKTMYRIQLEFVTGKVAGDYSAATSSKIYR